MTADRLLGSRRRLAAAAAAVIVIDQISKLAAGLVGPLGSAVYPVRNPALTLGIAHEGHWRETAAMAVGLLVAVVVTDRRTAGDPRRAAAAGLLLGGAASNLADRAA